MGDCYAHDCGRPESLDRAMNHTLPTEVPVNDFAVTSPPKTRDASLESKIGLAYGAQLTWRQLPIRERVAKLNGLRQLLVERREDIAAAIQVPSRQNEIETLTAEVLPLADSVAWLRKRASRILRPRYCSSRLTPLWLGAIRSTVNRVPHGLVLIIGASNYPLYLTGVQTIQALAAGNAVIIKPSPGAEKITSLLRDLLVELGIPEELVIVTESDPAIVNQALEIGVDKVVLTGSSTTGRTVLKNLAESITPATMELSGCDAVYVLPGADLHRVCKVLLFGLRLNGGATCMAPRRVFVSSKVSEVFHRILREELNSAHQKNWDTSVPSSVYRKLFAGYQQAITNGASVFESQALEPIATVTAFADHLPAVASRDATMAGSVPGEKTPNAKSKDSVNGEQNKASKSTTIRMKHLVLTNMQPDMELCGADIFAPLLMIIPVDDWAHALQADSHCPYALTASIYGSVEDALRLTSFISAGAITINDTIVPLADPQTPFGGRGESGFGVTQGDEGLLEMTTPQVISIRRGQWLPHAAPLSAADGLLLDGVLQLNHSLSWTGRWKGLTQLVRAVWAKQNSNNNK